MIEKKISTLGTPPGSIIYNGNHNLENPTIHHICYNANLLEEQTYSQDELINFENKDQVIDWYDLRGIHDLTIINKLGTAFNIHHLILEDIADIQQRPKYEEYENGNLILLKSIEYDRSLKKIELEQISVYYNNTSLISFQEDQTDVLLQVRKRVTNNHGRVRNRGAHYLAFSLVDLIVDNYFVVLEKFEEEIEHLESRIIKDSGDNIKNDLHQLKKNIILLKKQITPLRESISKLSKSDSEFNQESNQMYIRDLYDHTIQVLDRIDSQRDILNGLQDLYLSEISNKMNQIMKVLTIITTVFVPISFLAGLYGMNFAYMPELQFKYGFYILLAIMILIVISFLFYFKKNKWL